MTADHAPARSTSAARCPPAPPCWRRAPGTGKTFTHRRAGDPLRRRGRRHARRAAGGHVRPGAPARSCGNGCASGWSRPSGRWPTRPRPVPARRPVHALLAAAPDARSPAPGAGCDRALAAFDAATIATTHQFCQHDADRARRRRRRRRRTSTLVETLDDLVVEVVDDLYVRAFAERRPGAPPFDRADGAGAGPHGGRRPAGRAGSRRRRARHAAGDAVPFAPAVRAEVERRKRARRRPRLRRPAHPAARRAADPATRPAARDRMRAASGSCWSTSSRTPTRCSGRSCDRAFPGHADAGAGRRPEAGDLRLPRRRHRHLPAAPPGPPATHATLATNWRSDAAAASTALQARARRRRARRRADRRCARSAAAHRRRLAGWPARRSGAPLRVRVRRRDGCQDRAGGEVPIESGARARRPRPGRGRRGPARRLRRDRSTGRAGRGPATSRCSSARNEQATWCATRCAAAGVPAVVAGHVSVFLTAPAHDWLVLLEALEQPHRSGRVRAAALTAFVGWTAAELGGRRRRSCSTSSARQSAAGRACSPSAGWPRCWRRSPPDAALPARLLAPDRRRAAADRPAARRPGAARGRRRRAARADRARSSGCAGAIAEAGVDDRRRSAAGGSTPTPRRCRSSPSTRSKGLRVPGRLRAVRLGPRTSATPDTLLLPRGARHRVLDVGGPSGAGLRSVRRPALRGGGGRGAAAAVRRADPGAVARWSRGGRRRRNTPTSAAAPAARSAATATGRRARGELPSCRPTTAARSALRGLAAPVRRGRGGRPAARASPRAARRPARARPPSRWPRLSTARSTGGWRRTSYSALTAVAGHRRGRRSAASPRPPARRTSRTPRPVGDGGRARPCAERRRDDERCWRCCRRWPTCRRDAVRHARARGAGARRPRGARPAGRAARPAAPSSWPGVRCRVDGGQLAAALLPVLADPARPAGRRPRACADIPPADRLAELEFELPLAGGDRPVAGQAPTCARSRRCCAATCRPTTRSPATPTGSPRRRSPVSRCAATSPAASTRCCGCRRPARSASSSTTRPTWLGAAASR